MAVAVKSRLFPGLRPLAIKAPIFQQFSAGAKKLQAQANARVQSVVQKVASSPIAQGAKNLGGGLLAGAKNLGGGLLAGAKNLGTTLGGGLKNLGAGGLGFFGRIKAFFANGLKGIWERFKKPLLIILVVVAVGAALYFGWPLIMKMGASKLLRR
jgi:hypothetical protein